MIKVPFITILICFIPFTISAEQVFEREGNIYFVDEKGTEMQLTLSEKDMGAVLSPDKKQVIFVRQVKEFKDNPFGISETDAELMFVAWSPYEIWTMDVGDKKAKCLLKGSYEVSGNKKMMGWFNTLRFSPDSKRIYFLSQPVSPTTWAVHVMNRDGSEEKFLSYGNSLEIVGGNPSSEYYECLVVNMRKCFPENSPNNRVYHLYVLLSPEGEEIKIIGESDEEFWKEHKKL